MNRTAAFVTLGALFAAPVLLAQDVMKYNLKQMTVLAEDGKARVLHYSQQPGDHTPVHSHPASIVYVIKGGRIKYTFPDGSTNIVTLKSGAALLRPPVTHSDEALDPLEVVIIELKP